MIIGRGGGATAVQLDRVGGHGGGGGVEGGGGTRTYVVRNGLRAVIGCLGTADALAEDRVGTLPGVESVTPWRTPYRLARRQLTPPGGRAVVRIGDGPGASVGGPARPGMARPRPGG